MRSGAGLALLVAFLTAVAPGTGATQSISIVDAVAHVKVESPTPSLSSSGTTLTLNDVIRLALANSPDLRPAEDRVALADIQRRLAESAFGLKVSPSFRSGSGLHGFAQQATGVSASRKLPFGTELSLSGDASSWNNGSGQFRDSGYGFSLAQPLLRGAGPAATADRAGR